MFVPNKSKNMDHSHHNNPMLMMSRSIILVIILVLTTPPFIKLTFPSFLNGPQ